MKRLIIALIITLWSYEATAKNPATVQDYLEACSNPSAPHHSFCLGALEGIGFMLRGNRLIRNKRYTVCYSDETTIGQRNQVFLNWAKAHPKKWQIHGYFGMRMALEEAWPCGK